MIRLSRRQKKKKDAILKELNKYANKSDNDDESKKNLTSLKKRRGKFPSQHQFTYIMRAEKKRNHLMPSSYVRDSLNKGEEKKIQQIIA